MATPASNRALPAINVDPTNKPYFDAAREGRLLIGLCNNHPANRGGITKVIEAVRQLRGEAHPAVQVKNCDVALAHGTGGLLGSRHGGATLIMERE